MHNMTDINNNENSIAIIGASNRFPKSNTLDQYWKNIANGIELIHTLSDQELEEAGVDPDVFNKKNYVKRRAHIDNPGLFDANFFDMTVRDASITAPAQRWILTCAYEAFEDAAYSLDHCTKNVGAFIGVNRCNEWQRRLYNFLDQDSEELSKELQFIMSNDVDYAATRTSYKLNLKGPSFNISTACSTSLVAVHQACQSLLAYECDMALAGGSNIITTLNRGYLYEAGGIQSKDGFCRAFDASSSGTSFGSGVGLVLLKRLEEAVEDRDHIYAVIRATAINNDGSDKIGFAAPSVMGQSEVISTALAMAEVDPEAVDYVEAHGTGTTLGDPIEIEALTKAYRAYTDKQQYCAIGSVKTNMGHLGAAAGIAGLLKAVLALKHKTLPPSLHFENPNPEIDFKHSPFYVNTDRQDWLEGEQPRLAAVSSFGVGGTNAHAILEEAPVQRPSQIHRNVQLILLSARSETALDSMCQGIANVLNNNHEYQLGEVAYSQNIGRQAFEYRRRIVASNKQEAIEELNSPYTAIKSQQTNNIAFMFPGQGSQYANMAHGVYQNEPVFKEAVDHCADLLKSYLQSDIRNKLFPAQFAADLSDAEQQSALKQTGITQPALFVIEYAYAKLWQHWGVSPDQMIGHSVGEYVAAHLAGVMSLKDVLMLIAERGRLMQSIETGAMLSIPMPAAELLPFLKKADCDLAIVNAPRWCVASGTSESIRILTQNLAEQGVICRPLRTSHAYHSRMMEPVLKAFKCCVEQVNLSPPKIPFVSNVTGDWISDAQAMDPQYWVDHLRGTVHFYPGVKKLLSEQHTIFVEVGPGQTLRSLIEFSSLKNKNYTTVSSSPHPKQAEDDMKYLLSNVGNLWQMGATIDFKRFYDYEKINRVSLPTYPFEGEHYWLDRESCISVAEQSHTRENNKVQRDQETKQESKLPLLEEISRTGPRQGLVILQEFLVNQLSRLLGANEFDYDAPLIELGMTSLMAIELRTQINRTLEDELIEIIDLFDASSTINYLADKLFNSISNILNADDNSNANSEKSSKKLVPEQPEVEITGPLSFAQQRFWFLDQFENIGSAYHMSTAFLLVGKLDTTVLQQAFNSVVQRHDMLRARIKQTEKGPVQIIQNTIDLPYLEMDYEGVSPHSKIIQQDISKFSNKSFNLSCAPLFRVGVIRLSETHCILLCTMHHIICDAWSMTNFWKETASFYNSFINGYKNSLPSINMSYPDYIDWQQSQLRHNRFKKIQHYWQKKLEGLSPLLELPTDRPRPTKISYEGDHVFFELPLDMHNDLLELCKREGVTLYMVLLAAFKLLLARLTGQTDIVVGTPVSNRNKEGLRDVIGLFANTLVMRNLVSPTSNFVELLSQVKSTCLEAYQHQDMPFAKLVDLVKSERSQSYSPIYQVLFSLQDTPSDKMVFSGATVESLRGQNSATKFNIIQWNPVSQTDLTLILEATDYGLKGNFEFSTALFDKKTIERFSQHFKTLLTSVIREPTMDVGQLSLMTDKDYDQLIHQWNATEVVLPKERLIHTHFEKQAHLSPNATAVIFEGHEISYLALNQQANRLAHYLIQKGVKANSLVALYCERSVEMMVALIAILKAGGAYLPLDPNYPAHRLSLMLEDSSPLLVVTQSALSAKLTSHSCEYVCLDDDSTKIIECSDANPASAVFEDDLAYLIYTSGSTGKPKGIKVTHKNVVNFLLSMKTRPGLSAEDKLLAVTTLCFDIAVLELYLPLVTGACVEIASRELAIDAQALNERIQNSHITVLQATPTTWRMLIDIGWKGSKDLKALVGGEALPPDIVAPLLEKTQSLWNMYGPTETTVWSSCYQITDPGKPIVIGQPIANTQLYVLDHHGQPAPIGVSGELYIGGSGVSKGYHNNETLTNSRFLSNPFVNRPNSFMYRTGDLARWRSDGTVECLGRCDDQVKVRGYRIELTEVEAALNQSNLLKQSAVVFHADNFSDHQLIAYLVPHEREIVGLGKTIREFLKQSLPDYMIPSQFFCIDHMPLTENGKIDKKQLLTIKKIDAPNSNIQSATTDTEKVITHILSELLSIPVDKISLNDNFFEIGGHSLLLMRFITRIEKKLYVKLPLISVYSQPILSDIALAIDYERLKSSVFVDVDSVNEKAYIKTTDRVICEI